MPNQLEIVITFQFWFHLTNLARLNQIQIVITLCDLFAIERNFIWCQIEIVITFYNLFITEKNLSFDAKSTGNLARLNQIEIVIKLYDLFATENIFIWCQIHRKTQLNKTKIGL